MSISSGTTAGSPKLPQKLAVSSCSSNAGGLNRRKLSSVQASCSSQVCGLQPFGFVRGHCGQPALQRSVSS